jgi:hypothetical protein
LFVSDDFGETFRSLRANLPWGSTRCLREDIQNQNLLFAGTEFAAWVSLDRGANWLSLNTNLPTVAVHEIAIHPSNGEIVAATHGRSLWACDISGLRQLTPEHIAGQIALLNPGEVIRWRGEPRRGHTNRRYTGTNPTSGSSLWYALPASSQQVTLRIEDIEGRVVRELSGATEPGMHRVAWDLIQTPPPRAAGSRPPASSSGSRGSREERPPNRAPPASESDEQPASDPQEPVADQGEEPTETEEPPAQPPPQRSSRPAGRRGSQRGSRPIPNGTYRVILVVDGNELPAQTIAIRRDPNAPEDAIAEEELEQFFIDDEAEADAKLEAKMEGHRLWSDD